MSIVFLLLFSVFVPVLSAAPPPVVAEELVLGIPGVKNLSRHPLCGVQIKAEFTDGQVSAVAPTKPTTSLHPTGSTASGAQTSVKVTLSALPHPASSVASVSASSSIGNIGSLDPKQPTVPCPVTEQRNLVGVSGQTLTLPCRAPANASIVAVMWTRRDLKTKNVLLVQDGKAVLVDQQPWFKGRVTLKNQLAKGSDLSLVLKDVKPGDAGTYECRYKERRATMIITSDSISTINLTVPLTDDGSDDAKRQRTVKTVTLSVVGIVVFFALFVAVVVTICRRCRR